MCIKKLKGFRLRRQHLSMFAAHFPYKTTTRLFGIGRKAVYLAKVQAGAYGSRTHANLTPTDCVHLVRKPHRCVPIRSNVVTFKMWSGAIGTHFNKLNYRDTFNMSRTIGTHIYMARLSPENLYIFDY